jgi:hypothetical protein
METIYYNDGRIGVYYPHLPIAELAESGSFSIKCTDLKPGTYDVVVHPASPPGTHPAFLQKDGRNVAVNVTRDSMPSTVDVGAVTIPVP